MKPGPVPGFRSALYRGTLVHTRRDHLARRTFRYPVYVASLDLSELPALHRELRLFSHRGRNVFSFDERDYDGAAADTHAPRAARAARAPIDHDAARAPIDHDAARAPIDHDIAGAPIERTTARHHAAPSRGGVEGLLASLDRLRAAHGLPAPATTRLVTNLRVAGYVFNPVSFFLDYDARGALTSVIAEVNNTYGGRLRYVLGPAQRIASTRSRVGFRHARELFVSPFLHGARDYEFWFDAPLDGERLAITMHVDKRRADDTRLDDTRLDDTRGDDTCADDTRGGDTRGDDTRGENARVEHARGDDTRAGAAGDRADRRADRVFVATLTGARHAMSDRALLAAAVRYPLMTAQVIGLIHLEALKLRLAGVPYRRPGPDHRPLDE